MVDPNANLIFGAVLDNTLGDDGVSITIIATGFGQVEPELGALSETRPRTAGAFATSTAARQPPASSAGESLSSAPAASLGMRPAAAAAAPVETTASGVEIPAFLRRRRMLGGK